MATVLVSGGFLCPDIGEMSGQYLTTMQARRSEFAVLVLLPPATISGDGIAVAGRRRVVATLSLPIPTSFQFRRPSPLWRFAAETEDPPSGILHPAFM